MYTGKTGEKARSLDVASACLSVDGDVLSWFLEVKHYFEGFIVDLRLLDLGQL